MNKLPTPDEFWTRDRVIVESLAILRSLEKAMDDLPLEVQENLVELQDLINLHRNKLRRQ